MFGKKVRKIMSMKPFPYSIVDLTHTLDENAPTWDGQCGFKEHITNEYGQTAPFVPFPFRVQQLTFRAGMGTHIDAPAHCIPHAATVDQLALEALIAPCLVIDISQNVHERSTVSIQDIKNCEATLGDIARGTIIVIRSGWDAYWHKPAEYRNNNLFPSMSPDAAEFLLKRDIAGLVIDTPSPDRPEDGYPVHSLLLGANKYIVENATNLKLLPMKGAFILALPLKIKDGTEAPVRLIGLI